MTLSEIRSFLRILIDSPHSAVWSNTNLNSLINSSYREVVDEIIRRNPRYYYKSGTITTTASGQTTALPSDCITPNKIVNASNIALTFLDNTQIALDVTPGEPTNFAVMGPNLLWYPKADAAYSFTLWYHYRPTDLSAESDSPTLPPGSHDILAYGAAINCRIAKEDATQEYFIKYRNKLDLLLRNIMVEQTNQAPRIKGSNNDFYMGFD